MKSVLRGYVLDNVRFGGSLLIIVGNKLFNFAIKYFLNLIIVRI